MKTRFLLCLIHIGLSGITQTAYTPLPKDIAVEQKFLSAVASKFEQDVAQLSGPHKKETAALYKERYEMIKTWVTDGEVLTNVEAQAYLDKMVAQILSANPKLENKQLRISFSNSFLANASSMGEGTILFNIGLFHRLQNESQAAFVLCHELAHYYLNHTNLNIHTYINTIYSDEFQKKLKHIQRSAYGKNSQLEALTKNLLFKNRRHSRELEQAADSMALELMKNTAFDVREAASCLALLDSADKEKYNHDPNLSSRFHFANMPFKKSWLENDDLAFTTDDKENLKSEADSLKTHPDCWMRIEQLEDKIGTYSKNTAIKFVVDETTFASLRSRFDYEIIEHSFRSKNVSRALYLSLIMMQDQPNDPYLIIMTGKCLNELYTAQKTHELSKVADLPNNDYDLKYNTVLHFIQNLRLNEIAAISYHFLQKSETVLAGLPEFQKAYTTSKQHFNIQ